MFPVIPGLIIYMFHKFSICFERKKQVVVLKQDNLRMNDSTGLNIHLRSIDVLNSFFGSLLVFLIAFLMAFLKVF